MSEEKYEYKGLIEAAVMNSNANRPTYIKPMMDELKEVYTLAESAELLNHKIEGFDQITEIMNECYIKFKDIENEKIRKRLITSYIAKNVSQLILSLGEKHGFLPEGTRLKGE